MAYSRDGVTKTCGNCQSLKSMLAFSRNAATPDRVAQDCRKCYNNYARNRRKRLGISHREVKYGLTAESFQRMVDEQENQCLICLSPFSEAAPHVDHDHSCCPGQRSCGKCVRGLLCFPCNAALGLLKDDTDRMRSAIAYLERSK